MGAGLLQSGTNAEDSEWIVLDQNDWTGPKHNDAGAGGPTFAVIYDCDGNCLNDSNGDGLCDELTVMGCTDEGACNYDDCANLDDGSCVLPDDLTGCGDTCLDGVLYEFSITDSLATACAALTARVDSIVVDGVTIASGGDFADAAEERFCAPADACVQLHPRCGQLPN